MPDISSIQAALVAQNLDGWLFFDHHHRDPLAYRVLGLPGDAHVSRRWYYYIPATGEPRALLHRIEPKMLDTLPGEKATYAGWAEQHVRRHG
jgi:Xaa-Pro dipeptidase